MDLTRILLGNTYLYLVYQYVFCASNIDNKNTCIYWRINNIKRLTFFVCFDFWNTWTVPCCVYQSTFLSRAWADVMKTQWKWLTWRRLCLTVAENMGKIRVKLQPILHRRYTGIHVSQQIMKGKGLTSVVLAAIWFHDRLKWMYANASQQSIT